MSAEKKAKKAGAAKVSHAAEKKTAVRKTAVKTAAVKTAAVKKAAVKKAGEKDAPEKKSKTAALVSKETAKEMMKRLCQLYPDADCELTYKNDFELLTSVILSAQTTDVQVNKVTPNLFKKFPDARSLSSANPDEVKEIIKATGYYNNKAKAIQACATAILKNFAGKVPDNLEDLVTLPGVGRKTANVVLGVVHKIPGWTVDTHVQRLSARLGLTKETDPYKIELDLQKLFPESDWSKYSITLIWHGRRLCYARNPDCPQCPLKDICPSSSV